MRGRGIRTIDLAGTPVEMGRRHGAAHSAEIREYVDDRLGRTCEVSGWSREQVLALAERCLPAHREFSPDLYAEMEALGEAAGITPAEAMIVGGYTDFVDTLRGVAGSAPVEDACTAVLVPDPLADGAGFLAQTWDMHASATPHIVMLRLSPDDGPPALVFTTVGCLGQIGMNEAGIAVGINNLTAADGRIGVTWPFVVREVLAQSDLDVAVSRILEAELAGGHNFLLFDRRGRGYSVEAMPTARHVKELRGEPLVHTNHCLVADTSSVEAPRPADLDASSRARLARAGELLAARPIGLEDLMGLTRDEPSICRRPEPPHDYESCGAAIMRPATGDLWACWGIPSENDYERFGLEVGV